MNEKNFLFQDFKKLDSHQIERRYHSQGLYLPHDLFLGYKFSSLPMKELKEMALQLSYLQLTSRYTSQTMQAKEPMIEQDFEAYKQEEGYDYNHNVYNQCSSNQPERQSPYNVYRAQDLPTIIKKDVESKQAISCLDYGNTLMLYYQANFNSEQFYNLIDSNYTGRGLINYTENFKISSDEGFCSVCRKYAFILKNSCGHAFCFTCWISHISACLSSPIKQELFPRCLQEGCNRFANYQLIDACCLFNPPLSKQFSKLLCIKYCQNNYNMKICSNMGCGKVINISNIKGSHVSCLCGKEMCKYCGKGSHWPLECTDMTAWSNLEEEEERVDNSWRILKEQKFCPLCYEILEKKPFSLKVSCPCGYEPCWNCLNPWSGHNDQFFECEKNVRAIQSLKDTLIVQGRQLSHKKYRSTLKEVNQIQLSIEKVLNSNIDTLKSHLSGFFINGNEAEVLVEMRDFVVEGLELIKRCKIYVFLQLDSFELLRDVVEAIALAVKQADDYLFKFIPRWFQDHQGKEVRQKIRNKFSEEKGNFKCLINSSRLVIKRIKEGEILEAYEKINLIESPRYLDFGAENLFRLY